MSKRKARRVMRRAFPFPDLLTDYEQPMLVPQFGQR